jgi:hypothetical protein
VRRAWRAILTGPECVVQVTSVLGNILITEGRTTLLDMPAIMPTSATLCRHVSVAAAPRLIRHRASPDTTHGGNRHQRHGDHDDMTAVLPRRPHRRRVAGGHRLHKTRTAEKNLLWVPRPRSSRSPSGRSSWWSSSPHTTIPGPAGRQGAGAASMPPVTPFMIARHPC